MPNVMGREFPYTPQGMAAAQQYSQALGMRDGGSLGFRPVGMQKGGPIGDAANANRETYLLFKGALTRSLTPAEWNKFLYDNMGPLKAMAEENSARAAQLSDVMERSGFESYMRSLMQGADQAPPQQIPQLQAPQLQAPPLQAPPLQAPPQQAPPLQAPPPLPPSLRSPAAQLQGPPQQIPQLQKIPGLSPGTIEYSPPQDMQDLQGYDPSTTEYSPPMMNRGGIMSLRGY